MEIELQKTKNGLVSTPGSSRSKNQHLSIEVSGIRKISFEKDKD
jgi:hypothetical protein